MLYAMSRDKKLGKEEALRQYRDSVRESFELYLFSLLQVMRIAEYSKQDAANRMAKLLPTPEDRQFRAKFGENESVRSVLDNDGFNRLVRVYKLQDRIDEDKTRQLYYDFAKTDEYKEYLSNPDTSQEDDVKILLALYKHCLGNEMFTDLIEDNYSLWEDDESLVVGAIKKTLKALPAASNFYEEFRPSTEATVEFGEALFKKVNDEDEDLLQLIEPTLKNWDAERVAIMDMIMLKMALCELMEFPSIPTKVTLNEFVEISKLYSTDKSKDFINGILDRLMKQLNKEGKIKKEGRGLQE